MSTTTQPTTEQASPDLLPMVLGGKIAFYIPKDASKLSDLQKGWLVLAHKRLVLFENLTKKELAVQQHLNELEKETDLTKVQARLKLAKEVYQDLQGERLLFTNLIKEKLFVPATEFEKRADLLITKGEVYEVNLRKEYVKRSAEGQQKQEEIANFKAHLKKEIIRIGSKYRADLDNIVHEGYKTAISTAVAPAKLQEYLETLRKFMREIKPEKQTLFNFVLVPREEATPIFNEIGRYTDKDAENDLVKAFAALNTKFAMYEQDLANAASALNAAEQQHEAAKFTNANNAEVAAGLVDLSAKASVEKTDTPKLKVRYELVMPNNAEAAMAVMQTFMLHIDLCMPKLKVKEWANLKVEQMGAALAALKTEGALPDTVLALEFKQIEK